LATYGTESSTLNRDIAKRLATFERKVLEEYLGKLKYMKIGERKIVKNYYNCLEI